MPTPIDNPSPQDVSNSPAGSSGTDGDAKGPPPLAGGSGPAAPAVAGSGAKKYKRVGDYDILSKLGQGAMGSVYLAKHVKTEKEVALKILPPELAKDQELLERFKREARATQRLTHPNIVSAVDVGTFDKYHFIAMDYVDGPDLEKQLKKSGNFSDAMLLDVAAAMCSALEEIERNGIVHRDFKPSNIMVTSKGVYRLTDLGLASAGQGDQRLTLAGFAVGTPYYLSPEQARGELDVDIRADIYGLGATLYHLATGNVPFPGTNPVVVMTQHINQPLRPPIEVNAAMSKAVSGLICLMMEKDPVKRPQNTKQLRAVIEQASSGQVPSLKTLVKTTAISQRSVGKRVINAPAAPGDGVQDVLDKVFGFLPQGSRMAAAIVTLAVACVAIAAVIILVVMKKH